MNEANHQSEVKLSEQSELLKKQASKPASYPANQSSIREHQKLTQVAAQLPPGWVFGVHASEQTKQII